MSRSFALKIAGSLLLAASSAALAQQSAPAPESASQNDFQALRQVVEQQSKQLEALTQQIAELNKRLPVPKEGATGVSSGSDTPPAPATASPAASPSPASAAGPNAAEPPKAEAVAAPTGPKHTVAKGETLTSIAKRYNITLSELEKANKIENDRKLQIGQTLNIPPATTGKTPEPQTPHKENP